MKPVYRRLAYAEWIYSFLLLAGTIAFYMPSFWFSFTIDDPLVTYLNRNMPPLMTDYGSLFKTTLYSGTELAQRNSNLYRPFLMTSLSLNYKLAGNDYGPFSFHLINVILFGLSVVVVFLLVRIMLREEKSSIIAYLTATLFMIFPSHLESVCNIKNREEILAFLLGGISWCLILIKPEDRILRRVVEFVLAPLLYLLALFSKESALLLLPCMLIWEYMRGARSGRKKTVPIWSLSMAAAMAIYFGMRYQAVGTWLGSPGANTFFGPGEGILVRVLLAARVIMKYYLWDQLFTLRLDPSFSSRFILPIENPPTLTGVVCLTALISAWGVSVWRAIKQGSLYAFWVLFFLINSYFVYHLLRIGTAGAFRLMFTPSLALCVLLALAAVELGRAAASRFGGIQSRSGIVGVALLLPVILYYGSTTVSRMKIWRDDGTIYSYSAAVGINNPMSNYAAGQYYDKTGLVEKKLEYYERTLRIFINKKNHPELFDERAVDAFSIVAAEIAYKEVGSDPHQAIELANLAIQQFRKLQRLRNGKMDPNVAGPYYVKALAYKNIGEIRKSVETCREALKITRHAGIEELLQSLSKDRCCGPGSDTEG